MNCRQVTQKIDLHEKPEGFWGAFSYRFHLVHCHACRKYLALAGVFARLGGQMRAEPVPVDVAELDRRLLRHFTR